MENAHVYDVTITWLGNTGKGTSNYRAYERSHSISVSNKAAIQASSDPAFRGDTSKYNPEELLVASLSSCHMLWYLHLCSEAGIIVTAYVDNASGVMVENAQGGGRFKEVTLHPVVTVSDNQMIETAGELHKKANELCFISNSVNFPVYHKPDIKVVESNS